jgi:hypothetical protein
MSVFWHRFATIFAVYSAALILCCLVLQVAALCGLPFNAPFVPLLAVAPAFIAAMACFLWLTNHVDPKPARRFLWQQHLILAHAPRWTSLTYAACLLYTFAICSLSVFPISGKRPLLEGDVRGVLFPTAMAMFGASASLATCSAALRSMRSAAIASRSTPPTLHP